VLDGSMQALLSHRMSLRESVATAEGKRLYVRRLFATIADRYDLITVLLSYGRDRAWKRRLVSMARITPATRVLDLASGTGDIAFLLHDAGARVVVGLDITARMIELAKARKSRPGFPGFLVGDMGALPFASGSFDLVTTGYGLRNVPDLPVVLDEIARVLVPGGQLLSLDFNRPSNAVVRAAYLAYLSVTGSVVGWVLHRDPDTYRYIPESIRTYPGAAGVVRLMRAHGFSRAVHHAVLGGLMAIHDART
jgi:demethylmenaquinone methyltransferase/2-methoxy-6-polyprenyl-1,4-benzoquinol methylase